MSDDHGRSWHVTLRDVKLSSLATRDGVVVGLAGTKVVRSIDGGGHWTQGPLGGVETSPGRERGLYHPERVSLAAGGTLLGTGDEEVVDDLVPDGVIRSTDNGAHWRRIALGHAGPARSVAVLPDGQTVIAAAAAQGSGCQEFYWRSTDAGAHFTALPCTRSSLGTLAAAGGRVLYAAGGLGGKYGGGRTVARSDDAGQTWHTVEHIASSADGSTAPPGNFSRLAFADSFNGVAVEGGCESSSDQGLCGGPVWTTSDGGRSWALTGTAGSDVTILPDGKLGASSTVAVGPVGGRWRLDDMPPDIPLTNTGIDGTLVEFGEPGSWRSADNGLTWSRTNPGAALVYARGRPAGPELFPGGGGREFAGDAAASVVTSPDGQHLVALSVGENNPSCGPPSQPLLALTRAKGLPDPGSISSVLRVSNDAGASWRRLAAPANLLSVVRTSRTFVGLDACGHVAISRDNGQNWRTFTLPNNPMSSHDPYDTTFTTGPADIWINDRGEFFHADAAGGRWTRRSIPTDWTVTAVGRDSATAQGQGTSFWMTTDDGRTWQQHWPTLPGLTAYG